MKANFLFLILFLFVISCKKIEENKIPETTTLEKEFVPKYGKEFFEFDRVEYYKNEIDSIDELETNKQNSKLDKLKYDVILNDKPKTLYDSEFLNGLEKIGFRKSEIDKAKFPEINKIFVEKTANQSIEYACTAVYRDILIFKNKNKTVGIAKICFECLKNQILGTKANTENFGQDGDYKKLEMLLKK